VRRKERIDGVSVRRHLRVLPCTWDQDVLGVELRDHVPRRLRPIGRAGGDEPHVIEPRAAKGGVEEVVAEGILARQLP
jgi:hypothetical protein